MEVLGSIAEISGGDVDIIKADEVLTKFANLADEKVIATNVQLTLMLDRRMTSKKNPFVVFCICLLCLFVCFSSFSQFFSVVVDPLKPGFIASSSTKDVGTVTATSLASFEFKVRNVYYFLICFFFSFLFFFCSGARRRCCCWNPGFVHLFELFMFFVENILNISFVFSHQK
jgi:hypothetical protein